MQPPRLAYRAPRYLRWFTASGISPEMAVRLSKVFGGSAESWLVRQALYDLAQVRVRGTRLKSLAAADDIDRELLAHRGRIPKDIDLEF